MRLNPLIHARFERHTPAPARTITLSNVSSTGLALVTETKEDLLAVGGEMSGKLVLGDESTFPVLLKVVWVDGAMLGCRYLNPSPQLRRSIEKYFDMEIASGELLPIPSSSIIEEKDGTPLWFTGENNCELYLVVSGTRIVRFHMAFFGNYIEGGESQPLRVGKVVEGSHRDKPGHKQSALIQAESSWTDDLIVAAMRLVHQAVKLDLIYRDRLIEWIKRASK